MEITNSADRNALAAHNATKASSYYKAYAEQAKTVMREIQYLAENKLRALRGYADSAASEARKSEDAEGWNEIVRRQGILEDALADYVQKSLRTIG